MTLSSVFQTPQAPGLHAPEERQCKPFSFTQFFFSVLPKESSAF